MQQGDPRLLALRDLLPGRVLSGTRGGRYHVKERIGEGGQGWVYTASWDEPDGFLVIVKVLRPESVTAESLARFDREAQVLRMLGQASRPNPHIVRFFDHASTHLPSPVGEGTIELRYTVLEYVRGPTLEQVLTQARGMGLGLERVRRLGRQITLALEDVHAQKIVHRDLKPSNVLLANEGGAEVAKVTDFGLVKAVDIGFNRTTALAGASLGYAPPEQFEQGNKRVSQRTDVFSFASMFFEMLTGARAFPYGDGENPLLIVTRLLNGPRPVLLKTPGALPPELSSRPDVVDRLQQIMVRATAAEPSDRHASMSELWADIEPLLRSALERAPAARSSFDAVPLGDTVDTSVHGGGGTEGDPRLATPAAWTWRVRVPSLRGGAVRTATFDPSGEGAIAIGTAGLLRWTGGSWVRTTEPPELDVRLVRGLTWLKNGELLFFGARGTVGRLVLSAGVGGVERWDMPDKEVTFLGAHVDPQGTVTLVGERPSRRDPRASGPASTLGTIAQFARGKVTLLSDVGSCSRLRGVTRLRSGLVLSCGDWGTIVRLELGVPEHAGSVCGGHLNAIAATPDGGAVTVGAGGHALSLSPKLESQLEAVQTTRDLFALEVDGAGAAWAGSAQARLIRRVGGSWIRMSGDLGLPSSILALWVAPRTVRAVCDDGAVVEGTVA